VQHVSITAESPTKILAFRSSPESLQSASPLSDDSCSSGASSKATSPLANGVPIPSLDLSTLNDNEFEQTHVLFNPPSFDSQGENETAAREFTPRARARLPPVRIRGVAPNSRLVAGENRALLRPTLLPAHLLPSGESNVVDPAVEADPGHLIDLEHSSILIDPDSFPVTPTTDDANDMASEQSSPIVTVHRKVPVPKLPTSPPVVNIQLSASHNSDSDSNDSDDGSNSNSDHDKVSAGPARSPQVEILKASSFPEDFSRILVITICNFLCCFKDMFCFNYFLRGWNHV
jgi:hypothetical protein